jgi:probable HAF family extracellular repeat protein
MVAFPSRTRMARFGATLGIVGTLALANTSAVSAQTFINPIRFTPPPTITDLDTNYNRVTYPAAVNNSGKVVGRAQLGTAFHAFAWQNGGFFDLGTLPTDVGGTSMALGVNGAGDVAMVSHSASASQWNAAIVRNGVMSLVMPKASAYAVNSFGQIAGNIVDSGGTHHAVVFQNGTIQYAPTVTGCTYSEGQAINDSGTMAITALCTNGHFHASTSRNGVLTDLGGPWNGDSSVTGINASGLVVGNWVESGFHHGVIWSGGTAYTLNPLPGQASSNAAAINSSGVAVGYSQDTAGVKHAVRWSNYVPQDLSSTLTAPSGWQLEYATGINDSGQIAGVGIHNGSEHGFLYTPGQWVVAQPIGPIAPMRAAQP